MKVVLIAVAVFFVAVGVLIALATIEGGEDDDARTANNAPEAMAATTYTRSAVRTCLDAKPSVRTVTVYDEGNQLMRKAGAGELRVAFARNEFNLAFERNADDAESREADLREFNETWDDGYRPELVERRGNAVWEWKVTPNAQETQALTECLR
jgi:hypothetical protein